MAGLQRAQLRREAHESVDLARLIAAFSASKATNAKDLPNRPALPGTTVVATMFKGLINGLAAFWGVLNGPDNDPIIVGLLFGWLALVVAQVSMWRSYRAVLKAKDDRIEDLVETRNTFQDLALKQHGLKRKSSSKGRRK